MPFGCVAAIEPIISDFWARTVGKPSINCLDLGVGFGLWGALIRNYVDGGALKFKKRSYILGVEGFAKYKSPVWSCYDHVHTMTIEQYIERHGKTDQGAFDGVFLLDVLEHFEKTEGVKLLKKLRKFLSSEGRLYVATPSVFIEQGAAYGNPLEEHKSLWTSEDLIAEGFDIIQDGKELIGAGYAVLIGSIGPM